MQTGLFSGICSVGHYPSQAYKEWMNERLLREEMEPPPSQHISAMEYKVEDEQEKIIDKCCSCFYDCMDYCLDFFCC
ncbi:hypothetical protein H6P81_020356 [Aristolochia fimbriata]|uniref:Uncharacterized protein n=1 Tax=Aristolochia fimbriata TaxID=158543 RepID=A0AAV7DX82_ARIFI|nr:hypothetical protein H6P81_020356 [Aristolochia fimbriata]